MLKQLALLAILLAASIPLVDQFTRLRGTFPLLHVASDYGFTFDQIPPLHGKTYLVTGANSGLGKFTSKHLALHGGKVLMACRSLSKCNEAKWEILQACDKNKVKCELETAILDMASLESIKNFADFVLKSYKRIDSLILNAGVMFGDFTLTKDGLENQFGTNHIGHFYLTKLLLPLVISSQPSTIVSVASLAHYFTYPTPTGILPVEKLNDEASYDPFAAYGQSKLANILFTKELARRLKEQGQNEVFANVVHPGAVRGNLTRHAFKGTGEWGAKLDELIQKVLYWDEDISALTVLFPAVGRQIFKEKISGQYYVPIARLPEAGESAHAKNSTLAKEFWIISEQILADRLRHSKLQ